MKILIISLLLANISVFAGDNDALLKKYCVRGEGTITDKHLIKKNAPDLTIKCTYDFTSLYYYEKVYLPTYQNKDLDKLDSDEIKSLANFELSKTREKYFMSQFDKEIAEELKKENYDELQNCKIKNLRVLHIDGKAFFGCNNNPEELVEITENYNSKYNDKKSAYVYEELLRLGKKEYQNFKPENLGDDQNIAIKKKVLLKKKPLDGEFSYDPTFALANSIPVKNISDNKVISEEFNTRFKQDPFENSSVHDFYELKGYDHHRNKNMVLVIDGSQNYTLIETDKKSSKESKVVASNHGQLNFNQDLCSSDPFCEKYFNLMNEEFSKIADDEEISRMTVGAIKSSCSEDKIDDRFKKFCKYYNSWDKRMEKLSTGTKLKYSNSTLDPQKESVNLSNNMTPLIHKIDPIELSPFEVSKVKPEIIIPKPKTESETKIQELGLSSVIQEEPLVLKPENRVNESNVIELQKTEGTLDWTLEPNKYPHPGNENLTYISKEGTPTNVPIVIPEEYREEYREENQNADKVKVCLDAIKEYFEKDIPEEVLQKFLKLQGELSLHRLAWAFVKNGARDESGNIKDKLEDTILRLMKDKMENKDESFIKAKEQFESAPLSRRAMAEVIPHLKDLLMEQEKDDSASNRAYMLSKSDIKMFDILSQKEQDDKGLFYKNRTKDESILNFSKIINSSYFLRGPNSQGIEQSESVNKLHKDGGISANEKLLNARLEKMTLELDELLKQIETPLVCTKECLGEICKGAKEEDLTVSKLVLNSEEIASKMMEGITLRSDEEVYKNLRYEDIWLNIDKKSIPTP